MSQGGAEGGRAGGVGARSGGALGLQLAAGLPPSLAPVALAPSTFWCKGSGSLGASQPIRQV